MSGRKGPWPPAPSPDNLPTTVKAEPSLQSTVEPFRLLSHLESVVCGPRPIWKHERDSNCSSPQGNLQHSLETVQTLLAC